MINVPQVIKVILFNSVGLAFHFKNICGVHLVLNGNSKVICKLLAVDGGRHEDHLQGREPSGEQGGQGGWRKRREENMGFCYIWEFVNIHITVPIEIIATSVMPRSCGKPKLWISVIMK